MTDHPKCVGNISHLLVWINELYTFVFGSSGEGAAIFSPVVGEVSHLEAHPVGKLSIPALETPVCWDLVTDSQRAPVLPMVVFKGSFLSI